MKTIDRNRNSSCNSRRNSSCNSKRNSGRKYWIAVAASSHVETGQVGGFAQLGHGKHQTIKALEHGDWLVYYSPRTEIEGGDTVQAFTALGQVVGREPYQARKVDRRTGHKPYRVDVKYKKSAKPALARPLLNKLVLTRDLGKHWGVVFRRSRIAVSRADFQKICKAMHYTLPSSQ